MKAQFVLQGWWRTS
ncbi:trp operon leader peptide [Citrobacter sp. Awk 4]|uniref:trp operon leader peptide n=1 Tax=Citrobacter enshiensis TaxID=2971264 RepID=A0ABT8PR23_9ENTR|nr:MULTISPECIES: trp operon leader peptide [Citrobacter]MDA8479307.1 trp operon leader peptide [Citrobacter sp. Awk 4]MDN8598784.1 trp operon leader peptide [Citrobacter enshiensis]WET42777.1 trp operon leader peptide [Citrobacter enshiensis]